MKESPKLWDWVVKYGQFEPRNDEETDQQRRRRRQNTFAPELPQAFAAQHGGLAALRNRMKTLALPKNITTITLTTSLTQS